MIKPDNDGKQPKSNSIQLKYTIKQPTNNSKQPPKENKQPKSKINQPKPRSNSQQTKENNFRQKNDNFYTIYLNKGKQLFLDKIVSTVLGVEMDAIGIVFEMNEKALH